MRVVILTGETEEEAVDRYAMAFADSQPQPSSLGEAACLGYEALLHGQAAVYGDAAVIHGLMK